MGESNRQWVWRLKGLGGVLNMLEQLASADCPINRHRIVDLENCAKRLSKLVAKFEAGTIKVDEELELLIIKESEHASTRPVPN